jgi:dTDP-glucose 4,6-dehydratase
VNDKVLITGGAGFIGSNYVEYVLGNSENEIFVLDKLTYAGNLKNLEAVSKKIAFIKGDICDVEMVQKLFK